MKDAEQWQQKWHQHELVESRRAAHEHCRRRRIYPFGARWSDLNMHCIPGCCAL